MLEIFMLIYLTRHIGETVSAKGRKPGWYKFMTVVLWFGCELAGGIIGGIIVALTGQGNALAYLFALIGAAFGAGAAFLIAKLIPPVAAIPMPPPPPPTFGSSYGN
jgi:hypothetical protein